jgi:hypothetical protein
VKPTTARLGILLTAALIATSCSGDDDAAPVTTVAAPTTTSSTTTTTTTASTTAMTTTTTTVPEVEDVLRMPLTGEIIDDASEIPDRPALAVKLDNHPRAHPQAGLNEADIVFEEVVEYGTRFAAVFHTQDSDPLGPIRSGRSQDVGILSSLDQPLFAWSGGNAGVRTVIRQSSMVDLDAGFSPGYYRRSGRSGAPHNLFSSTGALWESAPDDFRLPPQQFAYMTPEEVDDLDGEPATVVRLTMGGLNIRWEYDEETEQYLRIERGSPHQTELTGQVSTDNLVVMAVRYQPSQADRRSPEAQVTGSGPLVVFTRGLMRTGYWVRPSILDPFLFVAELPDDEDAADEALDADEAGDDTDPELPVPGLDPFQHLDPAGGFVGLIPGRTWVELAQDAENFVASESGDD